MIKTCKVCGSKFETDRVNRIICYQPSCRRERARRGNIVFHQKKRGIELDMWDIPEEYLNKGRKEQKEPKFERPEVPHRTWTKCWTCIHAVPNPKKKTGCEWTKCGKPVPGWDATKRSIVQCGGSSLRKEIITYHVNECPKYKKGV